MFQSDYNPSLIEYGRELGNGIAGGLLYRGAALPPLDVSYVFFDFWNGFLGRFSPEGNTVGKIEWLLYDSAFRTSEFIRPPEKFCWQTGLREV